MIVVLNPGGDISIVEPMDFKRFSLQAARGQPLQESAAVGFEGEDIAWISEEALRTHPGLGDQPAWQDGLTKMIAFARDHGWVDAERNRIRAHIERADPS